MDNPETQAILGTRHRTKTNKKRMDNPETQAILGTRQRKKTNKTKNGQPRDTGNIKHKTEEEDK
jgi:hypothetical protein